MGENCMAKKKAVVLRGIHVSCHVPTEERLTLLIEGLAPDRFRSLAEALEDWFVVVDDAFKETFVRGRGWRGRGRRVSAKSRLRVLRFSPFPSRFSNILRSIRRDIYVELNRQCLVLEGQQYGGYKQNLYILPYANAGEFMSFIEARNREIDELNAKIEQFKKTRYFADLKETLKEQDVKVSLNGNWHLDRIGIDITPLALETTVIKELVEEEEKRLFEQLDVKEREEMERLEAERRRGLEALQRELERKRKELVVKGIENIQRKIELVVRRIVGAKKLNPKNVKRDIGRLRRIAVSVGLEAVASTVIDPLVAVVDQPEKAMELFGTKDLTVGVSGRIKGLIESL
jgi:hypothetical protein